jgi:serine phosphatase RsbU (regulator of sigma subunit)
MNKPLPRFLLLLLFLFCFVHTYAQEDSLRRELRKATIDTNKVLLYSKLAIIPSQDLKLAIAYLDSGLVICERVADKNYTGRLIKNKGEVFNVRGMPDSAAFYFEQVISIYTLTGNWQELGMTYYSLANAYNIMGKTDLAQKNFIEGAKMSRAHNVLRSEAYCTNGLATIHFKLRDFTEAERTHLQALKIAVELDEPKLKGWIYTGLGNTRLSLKQYDSARVYFVLALNAYTDGDYLQGIAGAHNNIGVAYSFMDSPDSAIYHYRIAAAIKHEYGELVGESTALSNISQLYTIQKKSDSAIFYARASLDIALTIGSMPPRQMAFGYLADAYATAEQYDSAYKYEVLFREYSDSVFGNMLHEQLGEMQAKYDSDQQQQQIALLEKNNEIGQLWNYFFAAAGGLVLVVALFVFAGYRTKKKANVLLEFQNNQITEQKKEITDSIQYAKRIQQALLASESLIKKQVKDHFVLYQPKDIVSGDFYWATQKNNSFWIAVCDSTGHGVPGAFMSLLNTTFLSEAINEKEIAQPGEVFNHARKKLIESLSQSDDGGSASNDGMDGTLIRISKNTLRYCGANGTAIHVRNGEVTELQTDKMPVGRSPREERPFSSYEMEVQQGDVVYVFTDGYADQFGGEKGKKFKHKTLVQLLALNSSRPAKEQRYVLAEAHEKWKGNLEQIDDVLIVGLFF